LTGTPFGYLKQNQILSLAIFATIFFPTKGQNGFEVEVAKTHFHTQISIFTIFEQLL